MASLEIISCSFDGNYLKTSFAIKVPNIKDTSFWKNQCGSILFDEKVIFSPGGSQSVRYCYKLKWDRGCIRFCKNDDTNLQGYHTSGIEDDFITEYEDTQRVNSRGFESRNSLVQDLTKIKNFTVVCKSETFTINKAILQARSPVFAAMLDSNFKEAKEDLVEITDVEPEIVEKMIEFFENDKIEKTDGFELDLYKIAHKYQSDSFMKYTRDLLILTLTFENAAERLKTAMICSDEFLVTFLCSWIRPNFQHICKPQNIFTHFSDEEICNIFRDK